MKQIFLTMITAAALILSASKAGAQHTDEATGFNMPKLNPSSPLADVSGNHVGLRVPDYEAAKKWWIEKLDFRVIHEWPYADEKLAYLAPANDNSFWVEILAGGKLKPQPAYKDLAESLENPGLHHICIHVKNIEKTLGELKKRGVTVVGDVFFLEAITRKLAFIADPWGNLIELSEVVSPKSEPVGSASQQSASKEVVTLLVKVPAKTNSVAIATSALQKEVQGAWEEPGNFKMELYQHRKKPSDFYLYERWSSRTALERHFEEDYTRAAFALQESSLSGPIEMNFLNELWPDNRQLSKENHNPFTTLIVRFSVKKGREQDIVNLFERFVPVVRKEKGNLNFHFHSIEGSPSEFVLYERWARQGDLDMHNRLDTTKKLVDDLSHILDRPIQQMVLAVKDISK